MYHPIFLKSESPQSEKHICPQMCGIKNGELVLTLWREWRRGFLKCHIISQN